MAENADTASALTIGALSTTDQDANESFTYSIVAGGDGGSFQISGNSLQFRAGASLNYETKPSYTVTVRTTDSGGLSHDQELTINLTDVDEFNVTTPTDSNTDANSVAENAANGTAVGVTASAADATTNGVSYSLVANANGATYTAGEFAVAADTGVVTVAGTIDREAGATRAVFVKATSADGSTAISSFTVNVSDVDEAPTLTTNNTITVQAYSVTNSLNNYLAASDPEGVAVTYMIDSLAAHGDLVRNGNVTLSVGDTFTQTEINSGAITYAEADAVVPAGASTMSDSFGFTVSDQTSKSTRGTFNITIQRANAAPLLSGMGNSQTIAENAAATLIDGSVGLSDADSANFDKGFLQAAVASAAATDQLAIKSSASHGVGTKAIYVDGTSVYYEQTQIGTIDGTANGANGGSLKINLNASATPAMVKYLIQNLTYASTDDTLSAGVSESKTITVTVDDGGAAGTLLHGQASGTATITRTGLNDAPVLTHDGALAAIDEGNQNASGAALNSLGITLTDADAVNSLAGFAIVGNAATAGQGTWQYSTNSGTNWVDIATTVSDSAALMLSAATLVRFRPADGDVNGAPGALSVRALDNTYSGAFSNSAQGSPNVTQSVATNNGATAISGTTAAITTNITAVNDVLIVAGIDVTGGVTEPSPRPTSTPV